MRRRRTECLPWERSGFRGYFGAVARLPQVSSAASAAFLQMSLPGPGATPFSGPAAEASPAGDDGVSIDRVRVLAGRLFDPADPHAVMISQPLAEREHLRPGGMLHLIGYPQRGANPDVAHAVRLVFRVSAVVAFTDQIAAASYPPLLLSPAFARTRQAMSFNPAGGALYLVLRPHADATAFTRQAMALGGTLPPPHNTTGTTATSSPAATSSPTPDSTCRRPKDLRMPHAASAFIATAPFLVTAGSWGTCHSQPGRGGCGRPGCCPANPRCACHHR